jgi:uridylate kinase
MKKVVVISLGGSLIIPESIDTELLKSFKKVLEQNSKKYRFVIVCGGGKTARNYIQGLPEIKKQEYFQSLLGIASTRLNARFLTYFFGKEANEGIPMDMKSVKNQLRFNKFVFCGALRYSPNQTSDSTAAKLANYFSSEFVNLTDIEGLYDKNPKEFPKAKFIPEINHKEFLKMANKIKFKPGQHFVLDQKAAKIIKKYKITTYILGPNMKNLDNFLNNKHYIGTRIKE